MANINKATLLFQFRPDVIATPAALLAGRVGGFSESWWVQAALDVNQLAKWASMRMAMMCPDCLCIGYRFTPYTYEKNQLQPGHAQVGSFQIPGKSPGETNAPTDTLRIRCEASGQRVTWTEYLHAIPDDNIESGLFIKTDYFDARIKAWFQSLQGIGANSFGTTFWLGRDNLQQSSQVLGVNGATGVITTATPIVGVGVGDYVRFRRVYDDFGMPIKGSFYVTAVAIGAQSSTYTLAGFPTQSRTRPSGTVRKDLIATSALTAAYWVLLSSRKIGRPTLLYRGRRGKVRV
jgi:hypothetical protein